MLEKLNYIINYINSSNLSLNEKIRYAYIQLGKIVYKDSMFFYTIQRNLIGQGKESIAYSFDKLNEIMNTDNYFDYKVICKTVAEMLHYIYENCGIESKVIRTLDSDFYEDSEGKIEIRHYFLAVTGEEQKKYALTLNPDLPNIKIGRQTSHFGNIIEYKGEKTIVDEDGNSKKIIVTKYEGEEIPFTLISPIELLKMDLKIGYLDSYGFFGDDGEKKYTDYCFELLKKAYSNDSDYIDDLIAETPFYYGICKLLNGELSFEQVFCNPGFNGKNEELCLNFKFSDKNSDDWDDFKRFVLYSVLEKLYVFVNKNLDVEKGFSQGDLERLLPSYFEMLDQNNYNGMFSIFQKGLIENGLDDKKLKKLKERNPLLKLRQTVNLFSFIDNSCENGFDPSEFSEKIKNICSLFVEEKYYLQNGCYSNFYIANKIEKSFNKIFDIGHKTEFNELQLAEQVSIIKEILNIIFNDLKVDKSLKNANSSKTAIQLKTLLTVVFDKQSHIPYYLMCVGRDNIEGSNDSVIPILFDLKNNVLIKDYSLTDYLLNYYVIKNDELRLLIENIETPFGNSKK